MKQDKNISIYYIILAVVAILAMVWYFFVYSNRLPAKPAVKSGLGLVKVSSDLVNSYNDPTNELSPTQLNTVQKSLKKSASSPSSKLTDTQLEAVANSLKK